MEITEEQKRRAEANRLAALAKRKTRLEQSSKVEQRKDPWKLFKCRKFSLEHCKSTIRQCSQQPEIISAKPDSTTHFLHKFMVRLEICSPDSFSVTPLPCKGFPLPGEEDCLGRLSECLSEVIPLHYTQNHDGGKACVYKLSDYRAILKCLKMSAAIEVEEIPWRTLNVVERFSHSYTAGRWIPCNSEHLPDDKVDELIGKLPKKLLGVLLPFQLEGLRFGLRRGGRCLIADEMGLGKTLQAIAIAGCFMDEGSILVVCPAILRFSWAEELERWLPFCVPSDIHLVFGHQNNPSNLARCPRVVVISYTMLHRLRTSMLQQHWALMIVDESHHVRCTKKSEPGEIKVVLDVASKVKRIVLLSGTPSLSRPFDIYHQINLLWPGLLGETKYHFAKTYCDVKFGHDCQGKTFKDFSNGIRLVELNVLLKQSVMIRRLKEHVLLELPPKRRQIIRLLLKKSDIVAAKTAIPASNSDVPENCVPEDATSELSDYYDDVGGCKLGKLSFQQLAIAKISGFREWLSLHPLIADCVNDSTMDSDKTSHSQKMIIFAHHHKVLDGVQEFLCEKEISFIRIDGNTLNKDRQNRVMLFQSSAEVKIAIVGIQAAKEGLDLSSAQHVVFLELPQSPNDMLQAEARAHRRGQKNAVNVYIFCAKDTADDSRWQNMNRSLHLVSSTTNGKYDAIKEIEVEGVSYLETSKRTVADCDDKCLANRFPREAVVALKDLADTKSLHMLPDPCIVDAVSGPEIYKDSELDANLQGDICEPKTHCSDICSELDEIGDKQKLTTEYKFSSHKKEIDGNLPVQPIKSSGSCSKQIDFLRFEVSPYTGRIHLYACVPGTDARPKPLFENFRPEELESFSAAISGEGPSFALFKDKPDRIIPSLDFIKQWNSLRPIERTKLMGKPLQLPLTAELCFLSESSNHNHEGLLKGGSKRRVTPIVEISYPLPTNAEWRKVRLRGGYGKKEKEYTQGWTVTDDPLCKLCQLPCMGNNARKPEYFEDLFCKLACYEEYRIRTSSRSLRWELFQVEQGVCTNCQLDCHKLVDYLRPLSVAKRRDYIEKVAPNVAKHKNLLEKLVKDPTEGNAWHADHIVPVYKGGGECRLENMRTLCVACHRDVTAAQGADRRLIKAKARQLLKVTLTELRARSGQIPYATENSMKDSGLQDVNVEDQLLVEVPGSAYSAAQSKVQGVETEQNPPSNHGGGTLLQHLANT